MLIQIDTGPGYVGTWNLMHEMFFPCREEVDTLGTKWENAKMTFYNFAKNEHDPEDLESAELYMMLMRDMDDARRALSPYMDEWYRARHGIGLN